MSETEVVAAGATVRHPSLFLMRNTPDRLASVELFAGAGGLALGCQEAGFDPLATLELDKWACDTVRQNQARGHKLVANWQVEEGDVRDFDWSKITDDVDLVAGGPPCQPFSIGGRGKADDDERDMLRRACFRADATGSDDDTALCKSLSGQPRKVADLGVTRRPGQRQARRI